MPGTPTQYDTKAVHPRLRLVLQTVEQRGDGHGALSVSHADIEQLKMGRKPCGKMILDPANPHQILMTAENLRKMGHEGVRCSWQSGDSTPVEFRLSREELEEQQGYYVKTLGL